MATWCLSPQYKKSAVEVMFFRKDNMVVTIEQGFRWATFKVESDERPLTDDELKNEDGYELGSINNDESWEMWDMVDGCWLDIDRANSHVSDEEFEAFEAAWEEDSYEGVEALGWSNDDTEYFYHGPLALTNEDTGEEFLGEPEENVSVSGVPHTTNTDNPIDFPMTFEDKIELIREIEEEKSAYTDWFPASVNPVRVGTYQILETEKETAWPFQSNIIAGTWDGKNWDVKIVTKWRGLTKESK